MLRHLFSKSSCGYGFLVVIGEDNKVRVLERKKNYKEKEGELTLAAQEISFADSSGKPEICSVSCGESHTVMLCSMGNVYAFGDNTFGQLGSNESPNDKYTAQRVDLPCSVIYVSAGGSFNVAIDENKNLWGWGLNSLGQLGSLNNQTRHVQRLDVVSNVAEIYCGGNFCICYTDDGKHFGWGHNAMGQLGEPQTGQVREISNLPPEVISVSCGFYHCLFLTRVGKVYALGRSKEGQCGRTHEPISLRKPTLLDNLPPIHFIRCGGKASYCIDNNGQLWGLSKNNNNNLLLGDKEHDGSPILVPGLPRTVSVQSNYETIMKDEYGAVWIWGFKSQKKPERYPDSLLQMPAAISAKKSARK